MATGNDNTLDRSKLAELGILGGLGLYGANQARQDANTQINNINASQAQFGPDSPYAQQMRQQLERRDAAGGRRSQYGTREVELQAKLAEINANQQAKSAPTLNALYQQRQGATTGVGRDIASILARTGAIKGLSPVVQGLFKRKPVYDQGDNRDAGLSDGYTTSIGQTDFTGGNKSYDSYDYQNVDNNYDSYDLQNMGNVDFSAASAPSSYDSYDLQGSSTPVDTGGFDLYNGVDAGTYDAYDFQNLPGFAEGGKVNIFDAIRQDQQQKTKGYKEINQEPIAQQAPVAASVQQIPGDVGPNDRQQFGQALSEANTASKIAGVKGGFLGSASMVPGIFMADSANDRTKATANAAIYAINPILGTVLAIGQDLNGFMDSTVGKLMGSKQERLTRAQYGDINSLNSETKPGERTWNLWDNGSDINRNVGADGMVDVGNGEDKYQAATKQIGSNTYAQTNNINQSLGSVGAFATGGHVQGPGTGTSDSILAKLSDGEYVNTAATVDSLGTSLFDKLEAKAKKSSPEELKKFKAGLQALF